METRKIEIQKTHITIHMNTVRASSKLQLALYKHKEDVRLELDGSYLNVMLKKELVARLGENEWMPLHRA